ncbi:MAG: peptidylprolyl isomerase [Bacteroidales bacterium]|jgi:peptidyl-prolyl cis-trans isomerase B (cyclophilin B)|nr:peptidylprolyl isomerase [Bacteroidales bacterium]
MRKSLIFFSIIFFTNLYSTPILAQKNQNKKNNNSEIMVKIETTKGIITVKLYNETPLHRDNFVKLVEEKYYDGLLFHRVINSFMIQGGDPDSRNAKQGQMLGNGGPDYTIPAEFNSQLIHKKGALAAARTADQVNPEKRSSGSQFYIVQGNVYNDNQLQYFSSQTKRQYTDAQKEIYKTLGGTPHLDGAYTVFGEVVTGLDIIDAIAAVKTDGANRPVEDVKIISMSIIK